MPQPLRARFRWTLDEFLKARRMHTDYTFRRPFRISLQLIVLLMLVGAIIGWLQNDADRFVCAIIAIAGAYYLVLWPIEVTLWTRYRFSRRPDNNKQIDWHFDDEGVTITTDSSKSHCKWTVFAKAVCSQNGILLYPNVQIFHWIPAHAFETAGDFASACELAQTHVANPGGSSKDNSSLSCKL